jgi:hypothetical protein
MARPSKRKTILTLEIGAGATRPPSGIWRTMCVILWCTIGIKSPAPERFRCITSKLSAMTSFRGAGWRAHRPGRASPAAHEPGVDRVVVRAAVQPRRTAIVGVVYDPSAGRVPGTCSIRPEQFVRYRISCTRCTLKARVCVERAAPAGDDATRPPLLRRGRDGSTARRATRDRRVGLFYDQAIRGRLTSPM